MVSGGRSILDLFVVPFRGQNDRLQQQQHDSPRPPSLWDQKNANEGLWHPRVRCMTVRDIEVVKEALLFTTSEPPEDFTVAHFALNDVRAKL